MAIATNLTDATASATTHATHHNDLATQVNALNAATPGWYGGTRIYSAPCASFSTTALMGTTPSGYSMVIPNAVTITKLAAVFNTAVAGSTLEVYLHADAGSFGPGTRLAATTHSGASASTSNQTLGTPLAITAPTVVWVIWRCSTSAIPVPLALNAATWVRSYHESMPTNAGATSDLRAYTQNSLTPTAVPTDMTGATFTATTGNPLALFFTTQ